MVLTVISTCFTTVHRSWMCFDTFKARDQYGDKKSITLTALLILNICLLLLRIIHYTSLLIKYPIAKYVLLDDEDKFSYGCSRLLLFLTTIRVKFFKNFYRYIYLLKVVHVCNTYFNAWIRVPGKKSVQILRRIYGVTRMDKKSVYLTKYENNRKVSIL